APCSRPSTRAPGPARPGAEVAVDVVLGESRVGQRADRGLGVQLGQRLRVGLARGMLVDTRDVRLALDRHGPVASWCVVALHSTPAHRSMALTLGTPPT